MDSISIRIFIESVILVSKIFLEHFNTHFDTSLNFWIFSKIFLNFWPDPKIAPVYLKRTHFLSISVSLDFITYSRAFQLWGSFSEKITIHTNTIHLKTTIHPENTIHPNIFLFLLNRENSGCYSFNMIWLYKIKAYVHNYIIVVRKKKKKKAEKKGWS